MKQLDKAAEMLNKALQINPFHIPTCLAYGRCVVYSPRAFDTRFWGRQHASGNQDGHRRGRAHVQASAEAEPRACARSDRFRPGQRQKLDTRTRILFLHAERGGGNGMTRADARAAMCGVAGGVCARRLVAGRGAVLASHGLPRAEHRCHHPQGPVPGTRAEASQARRRDVRNP
eukprot:3906533-Rhodomonas_salina.3